MDFDPAYLDELWDHGTPVVNERLRLLVAGARTVLRHALKSNPAIPLESIFDPGAPPEADVPAELVTSATRPDLQEFTRQVEPLNFVTRHIPPLRRAHEAALAAARRRFDEAMDAWRADERIREDLLSQFHVLHERAKEEHERKVVEACQNLERLRVGYGAGDRATIVEHTKAVIARMQLPYRYGGHYVFGVRLPSSELIIDWQLPPTNVVPEIESFRWVRSSKSFKATPMKQKERRAAYEQVICGYALTVLALLFRSDSGRHFRVITFRGFLDGIDASTGHSRRHYLVELGCTRDELDAVALEHVDQAECVRHLGGRLSRAAVELVEIPALMGEPPLF